jgi:chemotaxis-related protein WspB
MLFLIFQIGSDRYAIECTQVVEILPLLNWKCVPRAPAGIAGIIDYHGVPVPLIDLVELASGRPSRKWMSTRIIVVNYDANYGVNYRQDPSGPVQLLGLVAEQATEVMRRAEGEFADSGLKIAESPYLGYVSTGPSGTIQRVEIKHLLSDSVRNQLFSGELESA